MIKFTISILKARRGGDFAGPRPTGIRDIVSYCLMYSISLIE